MLRQTFDTVVLFFILTTLPACSLKNMKAAPLSKNDSHQNMGAVNYSQSSSLSDAEGETSANEDDEDDSDETPSVVAKEQETGDEAPKEVSEVEIKETRSAEEEKADAEAAKTFPLVTNELVESWIKYFTGRGRPVMQRWLARSTRFIPMMKQVLRQEGLPEDLIYLAMIESGFNTKAKSKAKAVGPWQFIKSTGQRYGLKVEYWVDERRDFRKSTIAAAQYLKELHQVFGSWYLAAAGYNAGEGKVLFAVRRDRTRNFWELARKKKKNFRAETKNYVPKIIAAALVSKNPEKYGFSNIPYEQPLAWETVKVPSGVSLKQIAQIIDSSLDDLELLNSELRRDITPPSRATGSSMTADGQYLLRVPVGRSEVLTANLENLNSKKLGNFMEHTIRKGDTLSTIARRYGSDIETLRELNKITSNTRLRPGQELLIPVGGRGDDDSGSRRASKSSRKNKSASTAIQPIVEKKSVQIIAMNDQKVSNSANGSTSGGQYTIQSGDSFWSISKKLGVSVDQLKRANQGMGAKRLRPGQSLSVPK